MSRVEKAFEDLKNGVFFKPIAGAAVSDVDKIYRWALVHTAAGASCLDVRWEKRCVEAAVRGRADAQRRLGNEAGDPVVMASVTPDGDVHTLKAKLYVDRCKPCPVCEKACPDNALKLPLDGGPVEYFYDKCRGCDRCVELCPKNAFE